MTKGDRASDGKPYSCLASGPGLPSDPWPHPYSFVRGPRPSAQQIMASANVVISIKREIGHLCHDENRPSKPGPAQAQTTMPPPPATETSVQRMSLLPSFIHDMHPMSLRCHRPDLFVCCRDCVNWALMVMSMYAAASTPFIATSTPTPTAAPLSWSGLPASQNAYVFPHETFGREFSSLS